ncbi:MAG: nucleotidyltransferase family protein [Alphaproteobacteria bacterium]|nr:nucleotidyltransferase family protein [Alphaproteobacteria bacterium]
MIRLLQCVADLGQPGCWIGGGCIRNAAWEWLHGRTPDCARFNDVDVVFFDGTNASAAYDRAIETTLAARAGDVPWSVKNQARMHARNGQPPYRDIADAVARWPETATAIAARLTNGRVELLAPHGVQDLVGLIVRPTPAFSARPHEVARRLREKKWLIRWPRLCTVGI